MAFTEFYCNASTGSNMNGGSDENTSPSYTATNGGWNSGTGVFTPTSGDPSASVTVGQFAHVFADGSTTPTFIGRVTAVDSTTVTVSTTAKSGTAPGTAGSGISINVGGVWKGPNGAVAFPFGFITSTLVNASSDYARVNFKNNATYSITAAMTHGNPGPMMTFEGYTSTAGDGGRAIIDGGTSGASYVLLTASSNYNSLVNLIFQNNGATGNASGLALSGTNVVLGVVVNSVRGHGFSVLTNCELVECEAYACNQSNTGAMGGFTFSGQPSQLTRCISHDNSGSNSHGFRFSAPCHCIRSIADTNGGVGFLADSASELMLINCDSYNNGGNGLTLGTGNSRSIIESCNFIKNGGYGINGSGAVTRWGTIRNCGFGAGTQANTSGATTAITNFVVSGSVTYASNVTPWVDPANGDFRINLAAAKNAGRGTFTETASSYSGTVGYPDIGAAQSQSASGGGLLTNPGMGGGMRG